MRHIIATDKTRHRMPIHIIWLLALTDMLCQWTQQVTPKIPSGILHLTIL
ncbi:hypothetical protein SEHO0A_01930 [Salmonella enterica subsp. houtenae str. ATCC BAA-1581]|nr:hypothetical protein SEHO0A_01930 [Salmonella enterica subsp. houtenae str. ATCC BAA-1581]